MAIIFDVKSTRGDTAERMAFATADYLAQIASDLKLTQPGQAVLVGSEGGYTGGRGEDATGKGIANNVGTEVKRLLGEQSDLNTRVHVIPREDGGHYAALSLNRSVASYREATANPVKRAPRKAKADK